MTRANRRRPIEADAKGGDRSRAELHKRSAEASTARIGTTGTQWRELALGSSGAVAFPRAKARAG